jgi:hypothetical protein
LQPVPVSEIKDIIISQAAMIAHAMGVSEVTREAAVELHHHVIIFLSCIDRVDKKSGSKMRKCITSYNYISLWNSASEMLCFGPFTICWDGDDEKEIQAVKPHVQFGQVTNWSSHGGERYCTRKAASYMLKSAFEALLEDEPEGGAQVGEMSEVLQAAAEILGFNESDLDDNSQ